MKLGHWTSCDDPNLFRRIRNLPRLISRKRCRNVSTRDDRCKNISGLKQKAPRWCCHKGTLSLRSCSHLASTGAPRSHPPFDLYSHFIALLQRPTLHLHPQHTHTHNTTHTKPTCKHIFFRVFHTDLIFGAPMFVYRRPSLIHKDDETKLQLFQTNPDITPLHHQLQTRHVWPLGVPKRWVHHRFCHETTLSGWPRP
jgi:hypothetical protein